MGDGIVDIELAHNLGTRSIWVDRGRAGTLGSLSGWSIVIGSAAAALQAAFPGVGHGRPRT
jgi:hypothetical protein